MNQHSLRISPAHAAASLLLAMAAALWTASPASAQLSFDSPAKIRCVAVISVHEMLLDRLYPAGSAAADANIAVFEAAMARLRPQLEATPITPTELESFRTAMNAELALRVPALADGPLTRSAQIQRERAVLQCLDELLEAKNG